jgi:hypothetical protein
MIPTEAYPRLTAAIRKHARQSGCDDATADDVAQEVIARHLEGRLCPDARDEWHLFHTARAIARRAGSWAVILPENDRAAVRARTQKKRIAEGTYRLPVVDRSTMPDPQTIALAAERRDIPLADALAAYGIGSRSESEPGWTPSVTEAGPPEWMPDRIPVGLGDPNPASREASRLEAINDWRRVAGLPPL